MQARQCPLVLQPIRIEHRDFCDRVKRLARAAERDQGDDGAEARLHRSWIDLRRLAVLRQRQRKIAHAAQLVAVREVGLDVIRLILHGLREVCDRCRMLPFLVEHDAEAVVRLGGRFVDHAGLLLPDDGFELFLRAGEVAVEKERGAEFVMQRSAERRVLVRQRNAFAEELHRRLPVARFERLDASQLVRQPALEQQVHVLLARVGHRQIAVAPLADVRPRFLDLPHPAIGRRQRRMQALGLGIHRQRVFEILHGAGIVAFRDGHASQSCDGRDCPRSQRVGFGEQRLGGVGFPLIEIQAAEPDQRREIVGLELQRALEGGLGLVRFTAALVEIRQVVRPADVGGVELLRVQVARLGDVEVLRRLKHHAVLSVRTGEIRGRRRCVHRLLERRVALAHLRLHAGIDARDVRQRDWQQVAARRRARDGRGEGADARSRREHPHFEPAPSTSVVYRSIGTLANDSTRPLGQVTFTRGDEAEGPRPVSTRGSFDEA